MLGNDRLGQVMPCQVRLFQVSAGYFSLG